MRLAIEAEGLVKDYITHLKKGFLRKEKKVVKALRGISFEVAYGEVFGLLGPNGAGKTTTVKILSTLLIPDGGRASVAGYNVVKSPEKVRASIGVTLSVERGFFWKLTGRENLKYFGMLKGLKGSALRRRVDELLSLLGMEELEASDKFYEEYSTGMKARLCLARALLADPPVLILDEPTVGLDPPSARAIRELLVRLAREEGKAVMVTTHNMFEAELICDRVAIINEGRIVAIGPIPDLKRKVSDKIAVTLLASSPSAIASALREALFKVVKSADVGVDELGKLRVRATCKPAEGEEVVAELIKAVNELGAKVHKVDVEEPTLEDVFITLTKSSERREGERYG